DAGRKGFVDVGSSEDRAAGHRFLWAGGGAPWRGAGRTGELGRARTAACSDNDLSAGKRAGRNLGSRFAEEDWRARRVRDALFLSESELGPRWRGGARAQCGSEPRPAMGTDGRIDGRRSVPGGNA